MTCNNSNSQTSKKSTYMHGNFNTKHTQSRKDNSSQDMYWKFNKKYYLEQSTPNNRKMQVCQPFSARTSPSNAQILFIKKIQKKESYIVSVVGQSCQIVRICPYESPRRSIFFFQGEYKGSTSKILIRGAQKSIYTQLVFIRHVFGNSINHISFIIIPSPGYLANIILNRVLSLIGYIPSKYTRYVIIACRR